HIQTVKVSIVDSHGKTAPTQIVEKAIEKREELRNRQEWEEDNDEIWCVFDTEDGSNELGLTEAYSKATNEVINLAISNPSFEYWYLLHYKDTDRVYPNCASLISELRRHLKGYEKNIQIYPKIRKKLPNAFQNAHLVRTRNLPAWTSRMNPSTGVDILVGVVKTLHDKKMQVA
ncbi:MAG: RloB family protein, partial [Bacillota bacterium]